MNAFVITRQILNFDGGSALRPYPFRSYLDKAKAQADLDYLQHNPDSAYAIVTTLIHDFDTEYFYYEYACIERGFEDEAEWYTESDKEYPESDVWQNNAAGLDCYLGRRMVTVSNIEEVAPEA